MNRLAEATPAAAAGARPAAGYRPPYIAAGVATLAVFALYAITLAPTTSWWDTSEYIATAHILGIPHPPGNPTFIIFARAWELLLAPLGLSVAVRINLFSAIMGALAHGCWFLVVHRIMADFSADRIFRLVGASLAVLVSATAFTVWNQSNVNEKVYTVSLFTIALLSWLAFHWRDTRREARLGGANPGTSKDDNLILLMIYILALSVGNHLMAFLAAPALVLFILIVEPRTLLNWKLYAFGLLAVAVGMSTHLFLPLRASLGPVLNEADPSTWEALWAALTRQQYDKPSMFMNPVDPRLPRDAGLFMYQIINYLQYYDWQWARSLAGNVAVFGGLRPLVTIGFTIVGVYGAIEHYKRDRASFAYIAVLFATLSLGLVFYLNFRYGYSIANESFPSREAHEVRERDYFFIVSFSVWGLWVGTGIARLWQRIAARGRETLVATLPRRAYLKASPVLAIALIPLVFNWSWANRNYDYAARDWAYNLLQSVEPYGVLFTNGDNDTFPLWYLQETEGIRQDVTVIVMSYLNTPWYVKQLRQLTSPCPAGPAQAKEDPTRIICQRQFSPDLAPPEYQPMDRLPTKSILAMTDQEIDQIANTPPFLVDQAQTFSAGQINASVQAGTVMLPADVFMAFILGNALGDRPVYYAATTQAYESLGLSPFLIRQGVAMELNNGAVQTGGSIVNMPPPLSQVTGQYLDLDRSDWLLDEVFVHRGGIPDEWGHWVDPATQGIPYYYAYTHAAVAQGWALRGDSTKVEKHMQRFQAWMDLAGK